MYMPPSCGFGEAHARPHPPGRDRRGLTRRFCVTGTLRSFLLLPLRRYNKSYAAMIGNITSDYMETDIDAIQPITFPIIYGAVLEGRLDEEGHQDMKSAALIQFLMDFAHAEPLLLIKMYLGNNEDLTGGTAEERIEQPEYVYLVKKLLENMIIDNIGVTQEHLYDEDDNLLERRMKTRPWLLARYLYEFTWR